MAEQAQRQYRLRRAHLDDQEHGREDGERDEQPDDPARTPRPALAAAEGEREQQAHHGTDEQDGTDPVDAVLPPVVGYQPEHLVAHDDREDGQRYVDVEDPAPVVLGEVPADQRPRHAGQPEHRPEQPLVPGPVAGRQHVRDDGERERHQAAGAEALDAPGEDELGHVLRGTREQGAEGERADREHQNRPAAVQVGDLAVERGRGGGGEQVRGDHPGVVVDPAQLADDGRQRGTDDGLVQRGQQHARHQAAHEQQDLPVAQ